ncbi:class I SAM-dependent rRNA methyltransferase [Isachenkonia alkalipeptolytica]|uniref:Class I SAM-dependent rRNA methyltransferase n=1 Tax=Isachenkonia alkalipeptolytica TaxID=2565777 RepID=A0AA43XIM0_9CLOT|nr:class I SAM-dependent rRNA methyltransferase [Isachenkonia alkalipeptolytica]NBG87262.1 class I SAM-dependent rRNA methyltransferase [Isachenkonia alkalipeptolytica]
MTKEIRLQVQKNHEKKYKKGYPLLSKEALINPESIYKEGSLFQLLDSEGNFIGRGYYGLQNKGMGWVLTHKEKDAIDHLFFQRKIAAAINKRSPFYHREDTTAFRIFNGEGDGIGGLTIDSYGEYYLINWYSLGIYRFREEILSALNLLIQPQGVYEKKRFDQQGQYVEDEDFASGTPADFPLRVKENGVNIEVNLNDGAMTGVFLDQREVRKKLRDQYAKGKTLLNTFSYTGVFSVFGALGGAKHTTSVDLAKRSLELTRAQFLANGIDPETQEIRVEDVFNFFDYGLKQGLKYDLVVLDPPSFARSKKHTFSAKKDYTGLLKSAIDLTEDQGVILASTNCATFDMKTFKGFVSKAFKEKQLTFKILEEHTLPKDFPTHPSFPEGDYLKVLFIKKETNP